MSRFVLVVDIVASLFEGLVDVVGQIVKELGRDRTVQGVRECHLNVIHDLTLIGAQLLYLPVGVEPLEDSGVLGLR